MYSTSTTEYEPIPVFRKLELRKHGPVYKFFNNALKNPYVLIAPAVIIALGLSGSTTISSFSETASS